ncbi:ATP synthase subunit f, mitochondrial [Erysiphe neolycopersici]|uniref:ATP synthase subunit f, mitochondrial n=1 Tax=Erysiphe neolycopersici TaxID=212602 RepID=A0A420H7Y6_9PEZI|nr:ATP synthase subunit f, mitochondrial [Erysiphe neolycopersici]
MSFITRRALSTLIPPKGIGAAQDAARMARIVSFYEKLPRGPAQEVKPKGIFSRYQARYFGKNPSATPIIHVIIFVLGIGYAQNYYFHLRKIPQYAMLPIHYADIFSFRPPQK